MRFFGYHFVQKDQGKEKNRAKKTKKKYKASEKQRKQRKRAKEENQLIFLELLM